MRKYIIGILIGMSLTLASSTYADSIKSLIGKVVQGEFPVTVGNEKLPNNAVVIDGKSYLPVRAIGELTGYDITFDADLGIKLIKKDIGVSKMSTSTVSEEITESIYEGMKSLQYGDENYFSLKSYSDTFKPLSWNFNESTNVISLVELDKGEVVRTLIEVNKDKSGAFIVHNGSSYLNVKYFKKD